MIRAEFEDNLTPSLSRIERGLNDPSPLAPPLAQILVEGNRQGLGTDAYGNPLAPLAPSTLKRRKASGPPLAPHGDASRIVTAATVQTAVTQGLVQVELSWGSLPWLRYAVSGTRYMPPRDVVGIRPQTMVRVNDEIARYGQDLLNG